MTPSVSIPYSEVPVQKSLVSALDVNPDAPVQGVPAEPVLAAPPTLAARARGLVALTKPNLSALVSTTGVLGYALAAENVEPLKLLHLAIGLWCTSGGAGASNMIIERHLDARMRRTRGRPLPQGLFSVPVAAAFALAIFVLGYVELLVFTTWTTANLALLTAGLYALVYTPLKRRGPIAIVVGAIPGAIPPIMGWAADRGTLAAPAWVLFGLLFLWQFPHFLALAWMYREDYLRADFDFLPAEDKDGARTGRWMALGAALLIPVTLLLEPLGAAHRLYSVGALAAGIWFLARTLVMARRPSQVAARRVFFTSIIYLPLLLALIVVDRLALG